MRIGPHQFTLGELAGAVGDIGVLLPLAVGYIAICGFHPGPVLIMFGLTNIILGLVYKLPMPLQPLKVVAAVAISQRWSPTRVCGTGLALGVTYLILSFSGLMSKIAKYTPRCVVRGIQLSLGINLGIVGVGLIALERPGLSLTRLPAWWRESAAFLPGHWPAWLMGLGALAIIAVGQRFKRLPVALVLVGAGLLVVFIHEPLSNVLKIGLAWPQFNVPPLTEIGTGFLGAGIAQIPMTIGNATIAVAALITDYFPDRRIKEKTLLAGQGLINCVVPLFGCFPVCHGAGGLAAQHSFGARTGGTDIIEGLLEMSLGLFLSQSIVAVFNAFPKAILGAMLIFVGIQLAKFTREVKGAGPIACLILTVALCLLVHMALGVVAGILMYYLLGLHHSTARKTS